LLIKAGSRAQGKPRRARTTYYSDMSDDKRRLAALARGVQSLRRQSRELRKEVDFLDRFSRRLPASACAAARSYLEMIEHGADLTLAHLAQLRAAIARADADTRVKRLAAALPAAGRRT
jgi:hypothetical protein